MAVLLVATVCRAEGASAVTTPTVPPLVAGEPVTTSAVTAPVVDLAGPVQDLVFGEASADGAVQDLGGRQFRLAADVLFAFDRADVTPRARTELTGVATKLRAESVTGLTIVGYTDSSGQDAYNLALSRRRAQAVRTELSRLLGVRVAITASGRGEADPVADNATRAGQALNRRVVITVR